MSTEESVGHLPYLAAMSARGWTWNEEYRHFIAFGALDKQGCPILNLRVGEWNDGTWMAHYGVPGVGYERLIERATPMEAADDAEAWLRKVLAPFSFPWLSVQHVPTVEAMMAAHPDPNARDSR